MLGRFAGVRIEREGFVLVLTPEGLDDTAAGFTPLAPGVSAFHPRTAGPWVGLERHNDGVRMVLQEQSTFIARIEGPEGRHVRRFGLRGDADVPIGGWGALASIFRLNTGNAVGNSLLVAVDQDGKPVPGSGIPIRIQVRKLGDPDADFEWMVEDIVRAVRSLALTLVSSTSLAINRALPGHSYEYEDLVFLRAIADDVEKAVERILRRPHYRIISDPIVEDAGRAAEIDPGRLVLLAADNRALARVESRDQQARLLSPPAQAAFTRRGRYWAPVRVPAIRRTVSYDTFENRFVRFVLVALRDRSHAIAAAARGVRRLDLAQEADALAIRFAAPLRRSPLDEVGTLRSFTMTSQVLLREDAYNKLLRLYREFLLTSDIDWDGFNLLQESRDAAQLYELWVYLETVRAMAAAATPIPGDEEHALLRLDPRGLVVNLMRGTRSEVRFHVADATVAVTYDRTYGGSSSDPRPEGRASSYSLALRPDVSIEVMSSRGRRRIFVDAKYRVDHFSPVFAEPKVAEDDEASDPELGTFKVADLNKMHAYHDAIGGAHAAVAAYPGAESRLFPSDPTTFRDLGGVGALALRPRHETDQRAYQASVRRLVLDLVS